MTGLPIGSQRVATVNGRGIYTFSKFTPGVGIGALGSTATSIYGSDGSANGAELLAAGSQPGSGGLSPFSTIGTLGELLLFAAPSLLPGPPGDAQDNYDTVLYATDGTTGGTHKLADVSWILSEGVSQGGFFKLGSLDGTVYFSSRSSSTVGQPGGFQSVRYDVKLYTSDGTLGGTHVISAATGDDSVLVKFTPAVVGSGDTKTVSSGNKAYFTTVADGGTESVTNGGTTIGSTVSGIEIVSGGGTASGVTITGSLLTSSPNFISWQPNSGVEIVANGGTAIGTTLAYGGTEVVSSGGTASDIIVGPAGTLVYAGGMITNVTPEDTARVSANVVVVDTTLSAFTANGIWLTVSSGGNTVGATITDGSIMVISSGGVASNTIVTNVGSAVYVSSGGTAIGTLLSVGGDNTGLTRQIVWSGGTTSGTVVIDGGLEAVLSGGTTSGTVARDNGIEVVESGGTALDVIVDRGVEGVDDGATVTGTIVKNGGDQDLQGGTAYDTVVSSGSRIVVYSGGIANGAVISSGGSEVLLGGIANGTTLLPGGMISFFDVPLDSSGSAALDPTTNILTFTENNFSYSQQLSGIYVGKIVTTGPLVSGTVITGTVITLVDAPCFGHGTAILTDRGEVPVENLRDGDLVRVVATRETGLQPVVWVGVRPVDCLLHPDPRKVWPVRVRADAFAADRPSRDLYLSADHAIYVDGVLIPVKYLINGTTVAQVPMDRVLYYHVELPDHCVLLAEGLPTESYLNIGDRSKFINGEGPVALHPDFASRVWEAEGCAPLIVAGPKLAAVRQMLEERSQRPRRPAPGTISTDKAPTARISRRK